jgi:rSAM/selenodomain-associated transferase 1
VSKARPPEIAALATPPDGAARVPRPRTADACALVVVAKYPRLGEVKTRLAAAIGAEAACALYRAFLADLEARLSAAGYTPLWAYTPADAPFAALVADAKRCFPQAGPDLNARLRNVFSALLGAGWRRVAIISSDAPHLPLGWLEEAYRALDDHDLVLGPADDGGYSLIAMAAPHEVFAGVVMSTEHVLAQTVTLAAAQGLRVHLLASTFDVDEPADLPRLAAALRDPGLRRALPRTEGVLVGLGLLAPAGV